MYLNECVNNCCIALLAHLNILRNMWDQWLESSLVANGLKMIGLMGLGAGTDIGFTAFC